jgi:hypothetical protein
VLCPLDFGLVFVALGASVFKASIFWFAIFFLAASGAGQGNVLWLLISDVSFHATLAKGSRLDSATCQLILAFPLGIFHWHEFFLTAQSHFCLQIFDPATEHIWSLVLQFHLCCDLDCYM